MRVSITAMVTDQSMTPAELAREVEGRGFDGVYLPEHTHIPVSRATPAPVGGDLPEPYYRTLDPFVALTAAAAVTERIRVGTGVCLVAQRDPIILAKAVASLDLVSGGRFVLGAGFGWNKEELADHGVAYADRRDVVRDRMHLMRKLWMQDVAQHTSTHANLSPSNAWPKPVQDEIPVWLGVGIGPKGLAALVDYATGWMPIGGRGVREDLPKVIAALEASGRDSAGFEVVPFGVRPDAAKIDYHRQTGCSEVVLLIDSGPRDQMLAELDTASAALAAFRGA